MSERMGIDTLSTCVDFIGHYITRMDPQSIKKIQDGLYIESRLFIICDLGDIQTRYLFQKDHPVRVSDILDDIYLIAEILGNQDWLPAYVNKIIKTLQVTQEQKNQSASENSSSIILLAFKLMCPKLNRNLNAGNHGDENGPTKKACKIISDALQGSLKDRGKQSLKPHLSFGSFLGHERSTCPCDSISFQGPMGLWM